MSLIPTTYSSGDAGAPQLTGQAGALINLLRAVLVTGYGAGAAAKAALGWTEELTATNKAVFRNSPVSGTGYRLRVLDDGSAAAGGDARSASLRAYSSMSSIDDGVDQTPTAAQLANGAIWPKSTVASSAARPWWLIGNERCFYLFVDVSGVGLANASPFFAGDLQSLKAGDRHNFALSFATASWSGSGTASRIFVSSMAATTSTQSSSFGLVIGRNSAAAAGPVYVAPAHPKTIGQLSTTFGGAGLLTYPSPVSGGMFYDSIVIIEPPNGPRGIMPGVYAPLHNRPFADLEEIANPDGLPPGRILVSKHFRGDNPSNLTNNGSLLFDRVGGW